MEYCRSRPTADEILNRPESIEYWEVRSTLTAVSILMVENLKTGWNSVTMIIHLETFTKDTFQYPQYETPMTERH